MGLIDIAGSKSVWRGMEYYKQNKELKSSKCFPPPALNFVYNNKYICIKGKVCTKNSYETLFYLWSKFFV